MSRAHEFGTSEVLRCAPHKLVAQDDGTCALCRAERTSRRRVHVALGLSAFGLIAIVGSSQQMLSHAAQSEHAAPAHEPMQKARVAQAVLNNARGCSARAPCSAQERAPRGFDALAHNGTTVLEDQFLGRAPVPVVTRGTGPEPPRAEVDPERAQSDDPRDFVLPHE